MKTKDVIVSFRGVRKTYDGETLVVKQLDLDIRMGLPKCLEYADDMDGRKRA